MKRGLGFLLGAVLAVSAAADERRSLLDNDPDVIYREEFAPEKIELLVVEPTTVYATKEGGRRLGAIPAGRKVEFLGMTDRAYRVRGQGTTAGIAGWISPRALEAPDPDFVENLKKIYDRQMKVRALIAAGEVAIGMTMDEVAQVLGKPTKTTMRRTRQGQSGSWEFIVFEDVRQYRTVQDPVSGQIFRQYIGTIREEKGRTTVEFENDAVVAIEESENAGGGDVKIVNPPLFFHW